MASDVLKALCACACVRRSFQVFAKEVTAAREWKKGALPAGYESAKRARALNQRGQADDGFVRVVDRYFWTAWLQPLAPGPPEEIGNLFCPWVRVRVALGRSDRVALAVT